MQFGETAVDTLNVRLVSQSKLLDSEEPLGHHQLWPREISLSIDKGLIVIECQPGHAGSVGCRGQCSHCIIRLLFWVFDLCQ
jgi:hypothetical protein